MGWRSAHTLGSRVETALIGLGLLLGTLGVLLLSVGYNNSLLGISAGASSGILGIVSLTILWGYGIYWSFDIRRALSTVDFRRQALGMGLIAASWGSFSIVDLVFNPGAGSGLSLELSLLSLALVLTFYWIDASIKAARRTDPLARDPFNWSKQRIALWALLIATSFAAYSGLLVGSFAPVGILIVFLLIVLPLPSLLTSVRRSRNTVMRKHLTWFGVALGSWIAVLAVGIPLPNADLSWACQTLAFLLFSYFIYRSAKALVPLNRISPE